MSRTAIILGATGLVGSHLLELLLKSDYYQKVVAFTRTPINSTNSKLENVIMDFDNMLEVVAKIQGDDLYSCLGTTRKKAGSYREFYKVDFTYQYRFIELAKQKGVKKVIVISSPMANEKYFFSGYLKVKGMLEKALEQLHFENLIILRPSVLIGERKEERKIEHLVARLGQSLNWLPGAEYIQPVHAKTVAATMLVQAQRDQKGAVTVISPIEVCQSDRLKTIQ